MTDREIKYLLAIPFAVVIGLMLVPVSLLLRLPTSDAVLAATTLGAVFPSHKAATHDAVFTKDEGSYPRFVRCALRINHEDGKRMAMRIAERLSSGTPLPDSMVKEALYYPIRYRYSLDARRKIYLAFYASDAQYANVDKACENLLGKPCKDLNERESVLLALWTEGGKKLFDKAKDDDAYLAVQIAEVHTRCP